MKKTIPAIAVASLMLTACVLLFTGCNEGANRINANSYYQKPESGTSSPFSSEKVDDTFSTYEDKIKSVLLESYPNAKIDRIIKAENNTAVLIDEKVMYSVFTPDRFFDIKCTDEMTEEKEQLIENITSIDNTETGYLVILQGQNEPTMYVSNSGKIFHLDSYSVNNENDIEYKVYCAVYDNAEYESVFNWLQGAITWLHSRIVEIRTKEYEITGKVIDKNIKSGFIIVDGQAVSRNDTKRGEIRIDFDNPQDITDYDGNVSIKAFFESDDRSYDNGEWFGYLLFVESGSSYLANTELPAYEEAMQTVYDELLWIGDKFTTTVPEDSYYGIDEIGDSLR